MARTSEVVRANKINAAREKALKAGKKGRLSTRQENRCKLCGRKKSFMRKFDICRICFRQNASKGLIMGVKKSSW